jgi:hypothetical protein
MGLSSEVLVSRHAAQRYAERVWHLSAPHPRCRIDAAVHNLRAQYKDAKLDKRESEGKTCNVYRLRTCYAHVTDNVIVTVMSVGLIERTREHRAQSKALKQSRTTKRLHSLRSWESFEHDDE